MINIKYYSTLNLKRHCTTEDINKAFGKLTSKYSVAKQAQDKYLISLCEAYEVLSNPLRRAIYDKYGEEGIKKGIQSDTVCIDPWTYNADVVTTYTEYCVLTNPLTRLFHLNESALDLKKIKRRPEIIKSNLKLTLNEIFYGATKLVTVRRKSIHTKDSIPQNETQFVQVKVPRGFPTGNMLKSEELHSNSKSDDVKTIYIFTTEDKPHKVFKRDNMNLIMVKNVSLKQALCGKIIKIETLDNKEFRVNITQIITNDYVKTIHNEGMPNMNNPMQRGNIIIKFNVIYPLYLPIMDESLCESIRKNYPVDVGSND